MSCMRYVFVTRVDQIPADRALRVKVDNRFYALIRTGDRVFAISDACPHEEASLSEGFVGGNEIECPRHGSRFDLRTGEPLSLPATEPVQTYPVLVDGMDVLVGIEQDREESSQARALA